jgi:hypothetical protein
MGESAVETLMKRVRYPLEPYPDFITFDPELMVRESTAGVPVTSSPSRAKPSKQKRNPNFL